MKVSLAAGAVFTLLAGIAPTLAGQPARVASQGASVEIAHKAPTINRPIKPDQIWDEQQKKGV